MTLQDAIKMSEYRKARSTHDNVTTTVEQIGNGYKVSYSGKVKPFVTLDALIVFLGPEPRNWTPIQGPDIGSVASDNLI